MVVIETAVVEIGFPTSWLAYATGRPPGRNPVEIGFLVPGLHNVFDYDNDNDNE
jgi:hypothetical protein